VKKPPAGGPAGSRDRTPPLCFLASALIGFFAMKYRYAKYVGII